MGIYKKQLVLLLIFLHGMGLLPSQAQDLNISGDSIYVNAEAEIMVRFPVLPSFFNTIPSNAPFNFKTIGTGFTIIAKAEKTNPTPLFVTEGGRNHRFVIVFKKNINYNNDAEMDYDFSSTKKLEMHIKEMAKSKAGEKNKPEPETRNDKKDKKDKKSKKDAPETNVALNYYTLLEEGDNNIKKKDYNAAKISFEKAAALRPEDQIPKLRLEEIKLRMTDQDNAANQEKNKQYVDIIASAKTNFNSKKYTKAQEDYKKALELKPGDIYAKYQLEKIDELLKADEDKNEKQKLDALYKGYISTAESFMKKNELVEARVNYEQALVIKPNDPLSVSKLKTISEKEKQEKEKADLESNYKSSIDKADKFFNAGLYDDAKAEYTKALAINKKTYPQDQLKAIDKLQSALLAKEKADKEKLLKDKETEQKNIEKAQLETAYNDAVKTADGYFAAKDYNNATLAYNNALTISKRAWPADQLKKIDQLKELEEKELKKKAALEETAKQAQARKKLEEKEKQAKEKEYKALIKEADKLFKKNDYSAAKTEYVKASLLSTEKWPHEQIAVIDKIFADLIAKDKAEKIRLAKETEANAAYTSVMDKANTEFNKGNYLTARKLYSDAALLKPGEKLPNEKLIQIQNKMDQVAAVEKAKKDSIANAAELKKQYVVVMSKAKSYYLKNDLENAKNAYLEAAQLKPLDEEPKTQLKAIQVKLDAIANAGEVTDKYEQKLSTGDSLLIAKLYEPAIAAYNEALAIKPNEYYPKSQINYCRAEIRNRQKELEDIAKLEAFKKEEELELKFRNALKRADQAVKDKNYEEAKVEYTEVLKIRPDHAYSRQRLEIVNFQIEREKQTETKIDEGKKEIEDKPIITEKKVVQITAQDKKAADSVLQGIGAIPYTPEELKVKYPNIDFANLPPEQPFNKGVINSVEKATIFKEILAETPRLNLSDTKDKVKLTCQGINFEGSDVYLKFLVQNNSNADFLTGAMMLTWTKRSGNNVKLYPLYIYPAFLPIVTPGKEATVIYVCKSYYINDLENLKFEMNDRLNKIKLEFNIPGMTYNSEEGRY